MQYIGAVFALIFVIIAIFFLSPVSASLHSMEYLTGTNSGNISTAVSVTTGNLTLTEDVYQDALVSITALSSTNSSDTPFVTSYDASTHDLAIGGLIGNSTRVMSADYRYDNPDNPDGTSTIIAYSVLIIAFAIIIMLFLIPTGIIARVWASFRGD